MFIKQIKKFKNKIGEKVLNNYPSSIQIYNPIKP